eukprot:3564965-Prymnesium_polylepis.1
MRRSQLCPQRRTPCGRGSWVVPGRRGGVNPDTIADPAREWYPGAGANTKGAQTTDPTNRPVSR